MFCKWCGNRIELTDAKCPTCGRVTPPVSDCGGFYNLKVSQVSEGIPPVPPVVMKCPIVEKLEGKYAKDRKASKRHHGITLGCFAITVVLILTVFGILSHQSVKLSQIKNDLESIHTALNAQPKETTSPETPSAQEPTETAMEVPALVEQNVRITTLIGDSDIKIVVDLGAYHDVVSTACGYNIDSSIFTASVRLEESQAEVDLNIVQEKGTIAIITAVDEAVFGAEADVSYKWEYRSSPDSKWLSLDEDVFSLTEDGSVRYDPETLRDFIAENGQSMELRCEISRLNESGGVLYIAAEGIMPLENGKP